MAKYGLIMLLWLVGLTANAETAPYLLQQIQQAKPTPEALEKAKKQVAEHKDIKLQTLSLVPFHLRKKAPIHRSEAYCTECHLALPHQKTLRSRAFLNMHTDYIACETCHFRPQQPSLNYTWFNYQNRQKVNPTAALWHSGRKKDDKTPLIERDGSIKIVPTLNGQVVIATRQHPEAKTLYQQWKAADHETKAQLKAKLHQPLSVKGPECNACHVDAQQAQLQAGEGRLGQPLLDLTALGANPQQRLAFETNTIVQFFARYQPEPPEPNTASVKVNDQLESAPAKEQRIRITQFLK